MRIAIFCLASVLFSSAPRGQAPEGVPVFEITPAESKIKFDVEASVAIEGTFNKWDATLKFTSTDLATGVLDIKIQAESVDTGSGMKDGKLKGKDFFDVKENPVITFKSTKIVQTGPNTFDVDGDFTIRGVTKAEKLALTVSGRRLILPMAIVLVRIDNDNPGRFGRGGPVLATPARVVPFPVLTAISSS
jgi:polyisoprenoid-binding protein YceI